MRALAYQGVLPRSSLHRVGMVPSASRMLVDRPHMPCSSRALLDDTIRTAPLETLDLSPTAVGAALVLPAALG
jgi:hypothetical protein